MKKPFTSQRTTFCFPNFCFSGLSYLLSFIFFVTVPSSFVSACVPRVRTIAAWSAAVDNGLEKGHFWAMSYLLTSDLKQRTAKVLAAALKKPQFVFRNGEVFVIRRVVLADVPDSGGGDMARVIADTWDKLGPAPEIDYDKL
jgi:hypothetical protein